MLQGRAGAVGGGPVQHVESYHGCPLLMASLFPQVPMAFAEMLMDPVQVNGGCERPSSTPVITLMVLPLPCKEWWCPEIVHLVFSLPWV